MIKIQIFRTEVYIYHIVYRLEDTSYNNITWIKSAISTFKIVSTVFLKFYAYFDVEAKIQFITTL